jgi:hypothetical protein
MSTPQFLSSIRESETITCRRCNTRQFPRNGVCIACQTALKLDYVSFQIDTLLASRSGNDKKQLARSIGDLLRRMRKRRGICQSQLAMRAAGCITRSSLSKAECGRMLLPLYKLLPLAKALGLTAVILRFDGAAARAAHQSTNAAEPSGT